MGSFGDISLAYQFSIVLGALIALTFIAAFVRLFWKKRRLAQNQLKQDLEAAEKATQKAVMKQQVLGEGDLFGVRAIEKGFYGGVAQSAPTSAASSPRLTPITVTVDRDNFPISATVSPKTTIREFSLSDGDLSRAALGAAMPKTHASVISLRLQPSDAELSGRRNHDPSGTVGMYLPSSASRPEGLDETQSTQDATSRLPTPPTLQPSFSQVQSYAQWRLSADIRGTARSVSKSGNRAAALRSQAGSIIAPSMETQAGRRKSRSMSSIDEREYLGSLRQYPTSYNSTSGSGHNKSDHGRSGGIFDQDNEAKPGIVSFQQPSLPQEYSRDISVDSTIRPSRSRNRSQEINVTNKRQSSSDSSKSLKKTRDSVRYNRQSSADSIAARRRSRQRDTMHYDPSNHRRGASGSVVGRKVDFDHPRSSPFDDPEDSSRNSSSSASSDFRSRSRSRSSGGTSASPETLKLHTLEHTQDLLRSIGAPAATLSR